MAKGRRSTFTISKYIAREYIITFIVSFFFFFAMFLVNQLLIQADKLLEKHIPIGSVLKMLFYFTPYLVGMTFPFATLVASLMAVGRFSSDNEILAFRTGGIRYINIFKPFLLVSFVLFGISLTMNSYFMYASASKRNKLAFNIAYTKPELIINANSNTAYNNAIIYAGNIIGSSIENLVIIDKDDSNNRRIIMAESALLQASSEQAGVTEINMYNVISHSVPKRKRNEYDYSFADRMVYNILISDGNINITSISDQDKTLKMLLTEISALKVKIIEKKEKYRLRTAKSRYNLRLFYEETADSDYYQAQYRSMNLNALQAKLTQLINNKTKKARSDLMNRKKTEFHKKLFMPIGCIVMTFLAFPLGMFAKRSGRSVGFIIGVLLSLIYWVLFMVSWIMAIRVEWAPPWILWGPNTAIFLIGCILYIVRLKK